MRTGRPRTLLLVNPEERQQPMPWMTITPEELMKRMAEENGGKFVNL